MSGNWISAPVQALDHKSNSVQRLTRVSWKVACQMLIVWKLVCIVGMHAKKSQGFIYKKACTTKMNHFITRVFLLTLCYHLLSAIGLSAVQIWYFLGWNVLSLSFPQEVSIAPMQVQIQTRFPPAKVKMRWITFVLE